MNIIQISPFQISDAPSSGGEVRVSEFGAAYLRANFGFDRSIVHSRGAIGLQALDVELNWWDRQRRSHLGRPYGLAQLRQMWAFRSSNRYARALANRMDHQYALVQVEHPWCFDLAWQLKATPHCRDARIVYSSHNVESNLQAQVWRANNQWSNIAERLVDEIRELEISAARRADISWATSEHDAAFLRTAGAHRVVVVPNGVAPLACIDPEAVIPKARYLLFVGSSHVPNVVGLSNWLAAPLTDMPTGCALVLAGSVGAAIRRDPRFAEDITQGRLVDAGVVSRSQLDQLIRHAHGLVLPVGIGGGTNLKTAEALVSGRPLIVTSASMRGFETFFSRPRLTLALSPADFRAAAWSMLSMPRRNDEDDVMAATLLWEHAFSAVWPALTDLGIKCA